LRIGINKVGRAKS